MTEAMSRHEIEDVLSSIRRLVSHDDRPAPGVVATPGKLVLTSALRVDEAVPTEDQPKVQDTSPAMDAGSFLAEGAVTASAVAPAQSVHPGFADAPLRAPLLTRIAQAGQANVTPPSGAEDPAEMPSASGGVDDNGLEATLARLEEALAIAPSEQASSAETVIDEDALADMVARIVRQELQGELGERITRNIRKLVRAEVARELQMRNL